MISLAALIRSFAAMLRPAPNDARLRDWAEAAQSCALLRLGLLKA
jgi:hypothetical protein